MEESPTRNKPAIPFAVILASSFVLIFCSLFSTFVFERVPHVNDENAYLFQAKLFQSGRLSAPSPCGRDFFDFPHIINNGKWYSIYPPGFPLLLAVGLVIRAPWLINPVLAALSVFALFLLGREIYGRLVGIIAALLAAVSPWFLLMSSTIMSHTSSLFFNSLFLLFLFRFFRRPSPPTGLAAGASWGMAFLVRPLNTFFFSLVFLGYFCIHLGKREAKWKRRKAVYLGAAALTFVGFFLLYNTLTNGSPLRMGYSVRYGPSYSLIFGRPATMDSDFTPLAGAVQMVDNLRALNTDLFGWPVSSFWAILPLLWLCRLSPGDRKRDLLLLSAVAFLIVVFSFFWGAFVFIGPRMLFEAVPLLFLLSARGINEVPNLVGRMSPWIPKQAINKSAALFILAFTVYGFGCHLPHQLRPSHSGWFFDRFDHRFAGTTSRLDRTISSLNLGRALVILKFWHRPPPAFREEGGWGSGFMRNDPDLRADIIYARDKNRSSAELFSCYPDRSIFLFAGSLDKGLLIPLKKSGSAVEAGEPIVVPDALRGGIELVRHPAEVFLVYSPEFGSFLEELFRQTAIIEIDGKRIEEMGVTQYGQGNWRLAAFCFEAALQLENDPATRRNLLNRLVTCYQRTGQAEAAKKVLSFMEKVDFNERRLYNVFPERGF